MSRHDAGGKNKTNKVKTANQRHDERPGESYEALDGKKVAVSPHAKQYQFKSRLKETFRKTF
jgi:hypothetical protein